MAKMSLEDVKEKLVEIIQECAKQTAAKPKPVELQRGLATIRLRGIDVPFHSTFLRSRVKPFSSFLMKKIVKSSIDPSKLVGKYIPNVTAKPFQLTKEYFEDVYKLTNSPRIGQEWLIGTSTKILSSRLEPLLNFSSLYFFHVPLCFGF